MDSELGQLHPPLEIDVGAVLLGIGGAWEDDVGMAHAPVAMGSDIDCEGAGESGGIELVGAEQEQGLEAPGAGANRLDASVADEAELERSDPRSSDMEKAETSAQRGGGGSGSVIGALDGERAHADDDGSILLALERLAHRLRKLAEER